jgi:hypothetical protein
MAKKFKRGLAIIAVVAAFAALTATPASAKAGSHHPRPNASWGEL